MKNTYTTPEAERIEFNYRDQVVAASGITCPGQWINVGDSSCEDGNTWVDHYNNN